MASGKYPTNDWAAPPRCLAGVTKGGTMPTWPIRAVLVGSAGTLVVTDDAGNQVTTPSLAAGVWIPMVIQSVDAGGTATGVMVGGG
jgi:hypothetical protein